MAAANVGNPHNDEKQNDLPISQRTYVRPNSTKKLRDFLELYLRLPAGCSCVFPGHSLRRAAVVGIRNPLRLLQ